MSRRNSTDRTGRSKKAARHVRLYYWMMQTAAWKSLSGDQRAVYVEMAARYNGSNNGRIHFSTREAATAVHIGRATAWRSLVVLQERGFIVQTTRGGFNVKDKQRQAPQWRLTEFNCDMTHALPSKDFAKWSPENISRFHPRATNGPEVKPKRLSGETETSKNSPERLSGETVKPDSAISRFHPRATYKWLWGETVKPDSAISRFHPRATYKLPGGGTSSAPASTAMRRRP